MKRLAVRWIATPWWNFRFQLGYWIGGFTHARRSYDDDVNPTDVEAWHEVDH